MNRSMEPNTTRVPQAQGIGEQDLVLTHLDEGGGEAVKVPEQGRKQGGGELLAGRVGGADGPNIVHGEHGVGVPRKF